MSGGFFLFGDCKFVMLKMFDKCIMIWFKLEEYVLLMVKVGKKLFSKFFCDLVVSEVKVCRIFNIVVLIKDC